MSSSFCSKPRAASSRIACGSVLMPTPSSRMVSACSNNSQPMPRARSIKAVVRPPIPPPTIIAFIARTPRYAPASPSPPQERGEGNTASLPSGLFGRKRLCRLGFQFGPGFRFSLNLEVVEILPVAHAVAEDLLLAGQIGRRTGDIAGAVPGGGLHRERGINQVRAAERHQIGPPRRQDSVDLV